MIEPLPEAGDRVRLANNVDGPTERQGKVVEVHSGGCLVEHDNGEGMSNRSHQRTFGWSWGEIEHASTADWAQCADRTPPEGWYLIAVETGAAVEAGHPAAAVTIARWSGTGWFGAHRLLLVGVYAWAPLPAPPCVSPAVPGRDAPGPTSV